MSFVVDDDDVSPFLLDVRDVIARMRDKGYSSIGEAFEDIFHDCWDVRNGRVVNTLFED